MKKVTFSSLIKEYRKNKHISQDKLALELGLTRQAISSWECEKSYPDISLIEDLSKLLDVDSEYLLKLVSTGQNINIVKRKMYIKFSIYLLTLVLIFIMLLFFIINRNKFYVYELNIENNDMFDIKGSFAVNSYSGNIIKIEDIVNFNNSKITYIEIISKNDDKIYSLYKCDYNSNDDHILIEKYGYNEFFNNFEFDNLYIKFYILEADETQEYIYKIIPKLLLKSSHLIQDKDKNIGLNKKEYNDVSYNKLLLNNYIYTNGLYEKKINDLTCRFIENDFLCYNDDNYVIKYIGPNIISITKYDDSIISEIQITILIQKS